MATRRCLCQSAFGPKHAVDSHLLEDCGDGAEAPVDFRSAAQRFLDESRLRNGHYRSRAHFECIDGAITVRPALQDQVKLRRIQLEQIAQQWQPRGSGQVGKRADRFKRGGASRRDALFPGEQLILLHSDVVSRNSGRKACETDACIVDLLSRVAVESPPVPAASQYIFIHSASGQQRSLMRTGALKNGDFACAPDNDQVYSFDMDTKGNSLCQVTETHNVKRFIHNE